MSTHGAIFRNVTWGAKIEAYVQPDHGLQHDFCHAVAESLDTIFRVSNIRISRSEVIRSHDSSYWVVAPEVTITTDKQANKITLDVISPLTEQKPWRELSSKIEEFLTTDPHMESFISRGTHVHVALVDHGMGATSHQPPPFFEFSQEQSGIRSSSPPDFDIFSQMKALAKAAVYFEVCMDPLVPQEYREDFSVKNNRRSRRLRRLSLQQAVTRIDRAIEGRADLPRKYEGLVHLLTLDDGDARPWRWEFASLLEDSWANQPIKFRLAPGASIADDLFLWPQVGCAFVFAAAAHWNEPGWLVTKEQPKVEKLREFLQGAIDDNTDLEITSQDLERLVVARNPPARRTTRRATRATPTVPEPEWQIHYGGM